MKYEHNFVKAEEEMAEERLEKYYLSIAPRDAGHQAESTWWKDFSRSGKQRQTEATKKRWKEDEEWSWSFKTPRQTRQKISTLASCPLTHDS